MFEHRRVEAANHDAAHGEFNKGGSPRDEAPGPHTLAGRLLFQEAVPNSLAKRRSIAVPRVPVSRMKLKGALTVKHYAQQDLVVKKIERYLEAGLLR